MDENNVNPKEQKQGNVTAALTYFAGWITGLVFLLIEKNDKFIRFHAAQSLVLFGALTVVTFIPVLGQIVAVIIMPLGLILWIFLMVKAYKNEMFELPIVAELAKKVEQIIKA